MRRVWAAVLSVWALLAIVAVLAWTRPPAGPAPSAQPAVVVKTRGGQRVVVAQPAPHATTQTSPAASQTPATVLPNQVTVAQAPAAAGGGN